MTTIREKTTLKEVYEWLKENEDDTWNEYISGWNLGGSREWYKQLFYSICETGTLEVVPVFGSNEGIYCHIHVNHFKCAPRRKDMYTHLFTLKTLDTSRENVVKCFTSAGRIYNHLAGEEDLP